VDRLAYLTNIFSYINERVLNVNFHIQQHLMLGTRSTNSKSNFHLMRLQRETVKHFSPTQALLWKQTIPIHRIHSQILLQQTWRCSCCHLKYYSEREGLRRQNVWIVAPCVERKETEPSHEKPFTSLNYSRTEGWKMLLILRVIRNSGQEWQMNNHIYLK
jgi:hypothetical protein